MSIGCIVIGLILSRLHRIKAEAVDEAVRDIDSSHIIALIKHRIQAEFLSRRGDFVLGLQRMAIVYSLPYALLLWGYVLSFISRLACNYASIYLAG